MDDGSSGVRFGTDPTRYRSYLLRLFREEDGRPWRFHVHCVTTGQEFRFGDQTELFLFLQGELSGAFDDALGGAPD